MRLSFLYSVSLPVGSYKNSLWKASFQRPCSEALCETKQAGPPNGNPQEGAHICHSMAWCTNSDLVTPPFICSSPFPDTTQLNTTQNIFSIRRENRNLPLVCLHSAACQPLANISIPDLWLLLTPGLWPLTSKSFSLSLLIFPAETIHTMLTSLLVGLI